MAEKAKNLIGLGLYSPAEAARYARISTGKFSRWVFSEDAVFEPQLGKQERLATFLDFAQSLSILDIRLAAGISLHKIRAAYRRAQDEHGIKYPFAVEHGIFVFGPLNRPERCELGILIPPKGASASEAKAERMEFLKKIQVQLTGKNKGNQLIGQVIQTFSKKLVFHEDSGLADAYTAHHKYGYTIVMDRNVRFGKPYMEGLGYEAETLAEAASIEGSPKRAARLYDVDEAAVLAALDYYKLLRTPPDKHPPKPVAA